MMEGKAIGRKRISIRKYEDDTLFIAWSKEQLIQITTKLDKKSGDNDLSMYEKKPQVMMVDRKSMNNKEIESFEVVKKFVYLDSLITSKGSYGEEIKRRQAIARNSKIKLITIRKIRRHHIKTNHNYLKHYSLLQSIEIWVEIMANRKKIEPFEM